MQSGISRVPSRYLSQIDLAVFGPVLFWPSIPALHDAFLPQRAGAAARDQAEGRGAHTEGDPREGIARGMRQKGRGCGGGTVVDEARGGREDGARRVRRDACLTEFPPKHRCRIMTYNGIERINRGIRRKRGVVGAFPDGNSALMLVTARLKYIVEHEWGEEEVPGHVEAGVDELAEGKGEVLEEDGVEDG